LILYFRNTIETYVTKGNAFSVIKMLHEIIKDRPCHPGILYLLAWVYLESKEEYVIFD